MSLEEKQTARQRLEKLQTLADELLEKLRQRITAEDPQTMNMQSVKHMTGVMKDIRDIQLSRPEEERQAALLTVCWEGETEKYSD